MRKSYSIFYILSFILFISAFYPWNIFLSETLSKKPVPLNTIVLFILSASLVFIIFQNSRYLIPILITAFVISWIVLTSYYYSLYFNGSDKIHFSFYFFPEKSLLGILTYFLLITFSFILWTAAFRFISITPDRKVMRIRFDIGLTSFLLLLLVKLIIVIKGGTISQYERSTEFFILFFVSGLFALSLKGKISAQLKSIFVILVFSFLILITVISISYFFSPQLKHLASSGSEILGTTGSSFERGITVFIRFFLDFRFRNKIVNNSFQTQESGVGVPRSENPVYEEILYVYIGFIALIIIFFILIILFFLLKRMFKMIITNRDNDKRVYFSINSLLILIKKILRIFMLKEMYPFPLRIFFSLKLFGNLLGIRSLKTETPKEYGTRLTSRIPLFRNEIFKIVNIYDDFIYGDVKADKVSIKTGNFCMKKIINPLLHLKRRRMERHQNNVVNR